LCAPLWALVALASCAASGPDAFTVQGCQSMPCLGFSSNPCVLRRPAARLLRKQPCSPRLRLVRVATLRPGPASGATALCAKVATDLAEAAKEGDVDKVQALLGEGAEADGSDDWGATALHLAVKGGHTEVETAYFLFGVACIHAASARPGPCPGNAALT
jgi:hypothetical protein